MKAKATAGPKCESCGNVVPAHVDRCVVCGFDVGYPNVRTASGEQEVKALAKRLARAYASADAAGSRDSLQHFEMFVSSSQAVMVRGIRQLDTFVHSDDLMLQTFHSAVRGQARLPEQNEWDPRRESVDSAINPYFYGSIHYAVLSGNERGVESYGGYHIQFREADIRLRTTVFEENGFLFLNRHRNKVPAGHRAAWGDRRQLAVAKLHAKIRSDTKTAAYPSILVDQGTEHGKADFVEVHIFGAIHRRAISRVHGPRPKDEGELFLWRKIKRSLESVGATVEEA